MELIEIYCTLRSFPLTAWLTWGPYWKKEQAWSLPRQISTSIFTLSIKPGTTSAPSVPPSNPSDRQKFGITWRQSIFPASLFILANLVERHSLGRTLLQCTILWSIQNTHVHQMSNSKNLTFLFITWVLYLSCHCARPRGLIPVCSPPARGQGLILHHLLEKSNQEDGNVQTRWVHTLPRHLLLPVQCLCKGVQI